MRSTLLATTTVLAACGAPSEAAPAGTDGTGGASPAMAADAADDRRPDVDVPTGEAYDPLLLTLAARVLCELAAALVVHHVCAEANHWEDHCPPGAYLIVHDIKASGSNATVRISCDTLKELTCGTGAFAADRLAKFILCGRVF